MAGRQDRWEGRVVASAALKAVVICTPVLVSVLTGVAVDRVMPSFGPTLVAVLARWVVVLVVSTAALVVADNLARRLLPLAALLRMTMAFPDQAPSRFQIARRSAGVTNLDARVRHAREHGVTGTPIQAAEEILVLVSALTDHDSRTRGHSERTHLFTTMLAEELGLPQEDRDRLTWASLVHDIGKLEVSTATLNKNGKPDDAEWEELRSHPGHGARICEPLRPWLGEWYDAIGHHHERWDGTGYPQGLAGTDISRAGRIVSVADAYEVITAARPYKKPMSAVAAREELVRSSGTHFDPDVVRAFLNISLGRLRLAAGPVSWVLQTPLLDGVGPLLGRLPDVARLAASSAAAVGAAAAIGLAPGLMPAAASAAAEDVASAEAAVEPAPPQEAPPTAPVVRTERPTAPRAAQGPEPRPATIGSTPTSDTPAPARTPAAPPTPAPSAPSALAPAPAPSPPSAPLPVESPESDVAPDTAPLPDVSPTVAPQPVSRPSAPPPAAPSPAPATPPPPVEPTPTPTAPAPAPAPPPAAPAPSPPTAASGAWTTAEDTAVEMDLSTLISDPDGDVDPADLTISVAPASGTVVLLGGGRVRYTPALDVSGSDFLTYRICDSRGVCASAAVQLTVTPANDPPVAQDDVASVAAGELVDVDVLANDADVDDSRASLQVTVVSGPTNGVAVAHTDGTIGYRSDPQHDGTDTVTYQVCDPAGLCAQAVLRLTVSYRPSAPVARNDSVTTPRNTAVLVDVLANDTDVDGDLDASSLQVGTAVDGVATRSGTQISFDPALGFVGTASFTYTVCDARPECSGATVTVVVTAPSPGSAPTAVDDDGGTIDHDSIAFAIDVLANDTDPDGDIDPTTLAIVTQPDRGVATAGDGVVRYTPPDSGSHGVHTFTYRICDLGGRCAVARVTITLVHDLEDDPVVAVDDQATTAQGQPVTVDVLDNDDKGDGDLVDASLRVLSGPGNGTAVVVGDRIRYTPAPGFSGTDAFAYEICSDLPSCDSAVVTVTVTASPFAAAEVEVDESPGVEVFTRPTAPSGTVEPDAVAVQPLTRPGPAPTAREPTPAAPTVSPAPTSSPEATPIPEAPTPLSRPAPPPSPAPTPQPSTEPAVLGPGPPVLQRRSRRPARP